MGLKSPAALTDCSVTLSFWLNIWSALEAVLALSAVLAVLALSALEAVPALDPTVSVAIAPATLVPKATSDEAALVAS